MSRKVTLNDRILKSLRPAPDGKPYDVHDTACPGHAIRVTGSASHVLIARFPGSPNPTRRVIAKVGVISLVDARAKAREWLALIAKGIDPQQLEAQQRLAEQQKRKNTFAAVAEDFIADKLPAERKGKETEADIRREFIPAWGAFPVTDLTDMHLAALIKAKKRTAPAQARNLLGTAKRLMTWAVDQRCYGLAANPFLVLKPVALIGEKKHGDRVLSDVELFALERAAIRFGYPLGPAYRMLIRTGLRLNEVVDAHWREIDLSKRLWVIPAERMKGRNSKARPHVVPLTDEMMAILESLPRFRRGGFLFSLNFGERPVWLASKVKKRVDMRMLRTLRALARHRGEDPKEVTLPDWDNHDIRRTVRTNLSRLKISEEAREAVMAHARPGIKGLRSSRLPRRKARGLGALVGTAAHHRRAAARERCPITGAGIAPWKRRSDTCLSGMPSPS
jgi:integrase